MLLPSTIGETLSRRAATDPQAPALVCSGLEVMSFGQLVRQIRLIDEQLRLAGIRPDSRVGIALPRGPEAALLSVAICCTATVLPINPTLPPAELEEELRRIRVDALIVPGWEAVPAWAAASNPAVGLFRVSKAATSLDDVVLAQLRPIARRPLRAGSVNAQSVCAIFRTSGTTGTAKRVPVTHRNLVEMARKMERWLGLGPTDRSACIMPIYYNAGFKATLVVPLLIGCSVAMPRTSGPQDFQQWIGELRPTWLTSAPAFLQALLDKLRVLPAGEPRHALRFVLSTASYLPESIRTELQARIGAPVLEFYGLCEAGMMTGPRLPPLAPKPGTVGIVPAGELEIRGEDGTALRPGKVGQVMLRGPSVMPGYLQDIDDTPTGLVDGWLVTGDLGMVDADGDLTVVGRTKEIINRGGEKVAPYDVEKVLLQHPAVREAAAFAVPHPRLGESVGAAVVLKEGGAATSSALIEFLRDRLAPFQMPRQVHVLQSLPKGATGKISRPQLSAAYADQARETVRPDEPLQIQIAEIWQRLLKRDDIGIDEDFFDAGGDSLQATEMLLELEAQTRQTIVPSQIKTELTIRHLVETLVSAAASKDELMSKVKDGEGRPLFICHGDFDGWGFYALRLADLLKHDGPIYLLHPNFDRKASVDTMEAMASRYIPGLLARQSSGAFQLAGYCHGGLAAWEIAHQLECAGRKVESVMLIDTFSINARPMMRGIARAVSRLGGIAPGDIGAKLRAKGMPAVWAGTRRLLQKDHAVLWRVARRLYSGQPGAANSLRSAYYHAMSNYVPPPIKARVVVVLSDEYTHKKEFAAEAWRNLAQQVGQEHVPGRHNTCITSHVGELAQALNRRLAAA